MSNAEDPITGTVQKIEREKLKDIDGYRLTVFSDPNTYRPWVTEQQAKDLRLVEGSIVGLDLADGGKSIRGVSA